MLSPAYWLGWNRLRAQTGSKFHALFDAVSHAMADTPRSSSLVENLNSRLRSYFTLRRHLGGSLVHLRSVGCCLADWDIIWQPECLP